MSRIYEALKKVQQENEQGIGPDQSPKEMQSHNVHKPLKGEGLLFPTGTFISKQEETVRSEEPIIPEGVGNAPIDERLIAFTDPQSAPAEQFKKIRNILSQLLKAKDFRTILVTSALPQEGKSITACNLGAVITQGFHDKAFLIDCDLRNPTVHHLFGLNGQPGLAELLSGKKKLSKVIHKVQGLKLKVIPAGKRPERPAELLSSDKTANFLRELKEKYPDHYIILDTTPLQLTAETGVLARIVDGIILVIMAGKTSRDVVKRAIKEIPHDKVIGIVFNYAQSKEAYNFKYYDRYYHRKSS